MKNFRFFCCSIGTVVWTLLISSPASASDSTGRAADEKIKLMPGFRAEVVVPRLGVNRHIVTAPNGDLFVKLERLRNGRGIFQLRWNGNRGLYEPLDSFGNYTGTGIAIRNGYLYASSDDAVFRYPIGADGRVQQQDNPQRIVHGLWSRRQHASKSIALDGAGNIYVNIGAPSNACQVRDRTFGSPGQDPCPILDSAGGIWRFRADLTDQGYAQGERYATGLRNIVGLDWNDQQQQLYAVQHGRDMLSTLYPNMFSDSLSAELPGEELFLIRRGGDYGWPYCYYDGLQNKKVLAPEYGGDDKAEGRCAATEKPLLSFPAHWGPNAMLFYTGNQFPERYRNGVFVAFHGSWNRAPLRQAGYNVAFVPFKDGKPSGDFEVFADGFTGKEYIMATNEAEFRPCGLSMAADGSLLVSDSRQGRVWKISWTGTR